MSNGFWGQTEELAHATFDRLAETQPEGTTTPISICLSTDEFHEKVSLQNFANILTVWVQRKEPIDVNIAVGSINDDKQCAGDTIENILSLFDRRNEASDLMSCFHHDPLSNDDDTIRFIDRCLRIPMDTELPELVEQLEKNDMLPPLELRILKEYVTTARDAYRLIAANGWLQLVQDEEDVRSNVYRIGRMKHEKIVQFHIYSINLFGAGRALQNLPSIRERASAARKRSDREENIHEYESLLLLGNDNRFYVSPLHLQHRVKPLGENMGDDIAGAIETVNMGDPVSNILMRQDIASAKMFVLGANDMETLDRMNQLENEGLIHEALEEFLLSETTMQSLPRFVTNLRPDQQ